MNINRFQIITNSFDVSIADSPHIEYIQINLALAGNAGFESVCNQLAYSEYFFFF